MLARVRKLSLAHPQIPIDHLAPILQRDPALAHIRWTSASLAGLYRAHGGVLPREQERFEAMTERARPILAGLRGGTDIHGAVAAIAARYPGFDLSKLWTIVENVPSMGAALRPIADRIPGPPVRSGPSVMKLDLRRARAIPLTRGQILGLLGRGNRLDGYMAPIMELERIHGENNGSIQPRLFAGADPHTRWIMKRVWAKTGQRELSFAEIRAHLPHALTEVLSSNKKHELAPPGLYARVISSAVEELADAYRDEVLAGPENPSTFLRGMGLDNGFWRLRDLFPELFPARRPATMEVMESLYARVLAGDLDSNSFYARAGIDRHELRVLQAAYPERFPRQEGLNAKETLRGRQTLERPDAKLAALSTIWKRRVVPRLTTAREFRHEHGVPESLIRQRRDLFPPTSKRVPGQTARSEELAQAVADRAMEMFRADVLIGERDVWTALNADRAFVARHGRISEARWRNMRAGRGDAFPPFRNQKVIHDALAEEIEALYAAEGDLGRTELVARLRERHPRMTRRRLADVFASHPELRRAGAGRSAPPGGPPTPREGGADPALELARLIVRLSPPGSTQEQLKEAINRASAEVGLPAQSSPIGNLKLELEAPGAALTRRILEEYALAAPRGTPEKAIIERVRRDYPRLSLRILGKYRKHWQGLPALVGRGTPPLTPRYLGGWDVGRALLSDERTRAELIRATQWARIPARLELLDELVTDLGGRQPFRDYNVLSVSHLQATSYAFFDALHRAGASISSSIIVGTPYGTNEAVRAALLGRGFDVRVPALSSAAYRAEVKKAVDELVDRHRQNHKPVVVLDDGGLVAEILHSDARYADVRSAFKIVEQTTRGINAAEKRHLETPVVNVARSLAKRTEARFIGRAVAAKVSQGLRRLGKDLAGKRVTIFGYGVVGSAVAAELEAQGAILTIVETGEGNAAAVPPRYRLAAKVDALQDADVVIGATGEQSLSLADLRRLKHGAVIASASSKQVEFDMEGLVAAASSRTLVPASSPLVKLPTARYRLGRREITVLGDGWPVNFDGDVEDVPPHLIQLTRAAMFAGALQALSLSGRNLAHRGVQTFDEKVDRDLVKRFDRIERRLGGGTIGDPDRAIDLLHALGARLQ